MLNNGILDAEVALRTFDGRVLTSVKSLSELREWLWEITRSPFHEATEHSFEESRDWPGTCQHCGWIHPQKPGPAGIPCNCLLIEHAQTVVNGLSNWRLLALLSDSPDEIVFQAMYYLGLDTNQDETFKQYMLNLMKPKLKDLDRIFGQKNNRN